MGAGFGGLGGRSSDGVSNNRDGHTDSDTEHDHLLRGRSPIKQPHTAAHGMTTPLVLSHHEPIVPVLCVSV